MAAALGAIQELVMEHDHADHQHVELHEPRADERLHLRPGLHARTSGCAPARAVGGGAMPPRRAWWRRSAAWLYIGVPLLSAAGGRGRSAAGPRPARATWAATDWTPASTMSASSSATDANPGPHALTRMVGELWSAGENGVEAGARLLARERVCRVATVDADGQAHVVPVCHVVASDRIYFGTARDARKVANLRANPRLAVTVDLYSEDWTYLKGVMVQGTAALIARGPRFTQARARLYAKYPQYAQEEALSPSDSVIVEMTPTKVVTWGLD
jgi:PPOX class probable F420-dependent enzyme